MSRQEQMSARALLPVRVALGLVDFVTAGWVVLFAYARRPKPSELVMIKNEGAAT